MSSLALAVVLATATCAASPEPPIGQGPQSTAAPWPLWEAYRARFIEADGKVVDDLAHHTTSEGQSYALFHALVAGDRPTFERVLAWTEAHLAGGDLGAHLPAWRWVDGKVADPNSASDADLWAAYALSQAALRWSVPAWSAKAERLLALIAAREVRDLPGLGPMLLPGPMGFERGARTRLNPSYLPPPLVRWAAAAAPTGPWARMADALGKLAAGAAPGRVWPDWIVWDRNAGAFAVDGDSGPVGSYDAIRVYLWAAMTPPEDGLKASWMAGGTRMFEAARALGVAPDRLDTGVHDDIADVVKSMNAPPGFQLVVALYAEAHGEAALARSLYAEAARALRADGLYGEPAHYYDQNLALFAEGFGAGRFRFRVDGALELPSAPRGLSWSP